MKITLPTAKTALLIAAIIFLSACGPETDDEDEDDATPVSIPSPNSTPSTPSPNSTPSPDTPEPEINSLPITPNNNLESTYELTIDASTLIPEGERAYLSVCDVDITTTNILSMNYDNCLLRSPVNENTDTFSLSLPNHINKLVAVVWFYDLTKEPLIIQWDKSLAEDMVWELQ